MSLDLAEFARKTQLSDGAWGTQLQKQGLPPGSSPELWNVQKPAAVEAVARSYVRAGSDVILTNTFGANRFALEAHGLARRAAELAEAGVLISRKAVQGTDAKVFASLGPSGKIVMMEQASPEELTEAFTESAKALEFGGADAIVLESFAELEEARLALRAVKQATDLPAIVCLTFASGPDRTSTMMGNSPADLVKLALSEAADGVGANCGVGPENYVAVAQMLRALTTLPIWVKPNAGLPTVGAGGQTTFPMAPKPFASFVPAMIDAGANFIGGCCGTTPAHIEAAREAVNRYRKPGP